MKVFLSQSFEDSNTHVYAKPFGIWNNILRFVPFRLSQFPFFFYLTLNSILYNRKGESERRQGISTLKLGKSERKRDSERKKQLLSNYIRKNTVKQTHSSYLRSHEFHLKMCVHDGRGSRGVGLLPLNYYFSCISYLEKCFLIRQWWWWWWCRW